VVVVVLVLVLVLVVVGRWSWVVAVGRGSWVVVTGRESWVVDRGSLVVGRGRLSVMRCRRGRRLSVVSCGSRVVGGVSWVVVVVVVVGAGCGSWFVCHGSWVIGRSGRGSWVLGCVGRGRRSWVVGRGSWSVVGRRSSTR